MATYANAAGSRDYKLYIPANRTERAPLIVMLHGCTQSPDDFAAGTRMNALAEEHSFLVAYPAQHRLANGRQCWNWFQPEDQRRGHGEPSLIAGITQEVMRQHPVESKAGLHRRAFSRRRGGGHHGGCLFRSLRGRRGAFGLAIGCGSSPRPSKKRSLISSPSPSISSTISGKAAGAGTRSSKTSTKSSRANIATTGTGTPTHFTGRPAGEYKENAFYQLYTMMR